MVLQVDVSEAMEKASNSSDVKKLKSYFLCSCFACIKKTDEKIDHWTLLYYDEKAKKVVDCFVNEKFVTIGDETPPIAEIEKPDFGDLQITAEEAIEKAGENYRKSTLNILITLHQKGSLVWTINFISGDFMATTVDVDAKNGKILKEEETSLVRRL